MNMDSDKASVAAMTRIVKEKDQQIEELSEQLKVYADDLDNNAAIIEDLRAEIQKCEFHFISIFCLTKFFISALSVKISILKTKLSKFTYLQRN